MVTGYRSNWKSNIKKDNSDVFNSKKIGINPGFIFNNSREV